LREEASGFYAALGEAFRDHWGITTPFGSGGPTAAAPDFDPRSGS
jgi:hypothetical protein